MQSNVLEYFELGALRNCPERAAIAEHDRCYSFAELAHYAKNMAAVLLRSQLGRNEPIAVYLPKGAETIVADLGILYTGNCYANLDIKSPPTRLKSIWENLERPYVVTSAGNVAALAALGLPTERIVPVSTAMVDQVLFDDRVLSEIRLQLIDTDPVCIIHTSGSTGVPKGVVLHHRGTIDFMDWVFSTLGVDGSEVIGSLSPFYFDIYTLELFLCLAKGATLIPIPEQLSAFPARLVEFLRDKAVSFIFWVPTVMVNIANMNLLSGDGLPALSKVFFAGEVFPTRHLNYWRRHLSEATFVNLYGPIEIHVDCTYFVVDREFNDDEKLPIGRPCRNTDVLILDAEDRPAAPGEHGELCIRGSSVGHGYWNNAERTAGTFTQNPLNKHYPEKIYRTGDIVYTNERGEIMFVGRKDFQIKHLGYRIELGEIEHAVLQVDGIRNCCVIYDREMKEIVLHYESAAALAPAFIREMLLKLIPKYMVPTRFFQTDQLPRNPNGKIDRQALARPQL